MQTFEVFSWQALTFIVPVVSLLRCTSMAFNGAGVRDTARTLKIGINTVMRTLKNSRHDE